MAQKTDSNVDRVVNEIKNTSRDTVAMRRNGAPPAHKALLDLALEKYDKEQDEIRLSKRDDREEKTLELASKAQKQAEKSYQQSWIAICIAGIAALVTIAIAFVK